MIKLHLIYLLTLSTFLFPIYPQTLTINHLSDLNFGEVFMGYSAEVQHTDPNAEEFSISHTIKQIDILVQFTLPSALTYQGYSVPITFDYTHSAWSLNDLAYGRTNFEPFSQLTINNLKNKDIVYLWLGGIINVPLNINPGTYQGTIIITVEIL
jgi:hypothetical protein